MDGCYLNHVPKREPLLSKSAKHYQNELAKSYQRIFFKTKFQLEIWIIFRSFQHFFIKDNPYLRLAIDDAKMYLKSFNSRLLVYSNYTELDVYIGGAKLHVKQLKETSPQSSICALMDYTQRY